MNKVFCITAFFSVLALTGCVQSPKEAVSQVSENADNKCFKEFKALKSLNPAAFDVYRQQFDTLNAAYAVYKQNGDLMNKDSKEILALELSDKQRLICARVKSAVFKDVEKRALDINSI